MRRARGILIALVALALSAGAVFAARALPEAAAGGLERAADASGRTLPANLPAPATEEEPDADVDDDEDPDTDEEADAEGEHGALVSEAAEGETPAGWANHGAYVSAVARGLAEVGEPASDEVVAAGGRAQKPKPEGAGKPEWAGKPDGTGKPDKTKP